MTSERRYTRIPPESTGDRVQMNVTIDVPYDNKANVWVTGYLVNCPTSGFTGTITRLREDTATSGVVSLRPDINSEDNNISPIIGENIQYQDITIATVASGAQEDIYTPAYKLVGWRGSHSGLDVDKRGNANVRFLEGNPSLDAYGKLRISEAHPIGNYVFSQDLLPKYMSDTVAGAASVAWSPTSKCATATTTTSNGDRVFFRSDQYHHTIPGESQFIAISVACGDTGKPNLIRRWGYFDDDNGVFFQQSGTDTLSLVYRTSLSGSPVDISIPQTDWNNDKGNGEGGELNITGMNIDVSLSNVYWIDLQDGDGRIRFGCYYEGEKITFHEVYGTNQTPDLLAQTSRLPLAIEQINTGVVGSISEMKWFSGSVFYEASLETEDLGRPATFTLEGSTSGAGETLIGGFRFAATLANGNTNRNTYFPERIAMQSIDPVAGAAGWIKLRVYEDATISGGTWDTVTNTNFETNTTGTIGVTGELMAVYFVNGIEKVDLAAIYNNSNNSALRNKADGTQSTYYVTAERQVGANDINVDITYVIKELTA